MNDELNELRREIDGVDDELIRLFRRRMDISAKISDCKRNNGLPTFDPGRERALLARVAEKSGDKFAEYSESVYRAILAASRSYQNALSGSESRIYLQVRSSLRDTAPMFPQRAIVACVGTDGGTAERISRRLFKLLTVMYFDTPEHALRAVETGMCRFALLEADDGTAGTRNKIYELLCSGFYIVRAVGSEEPLCLAVRYGLTEPREICSDAASFERCSGQSFRERIYFADVSAAARFAAETADKSCAAICPRFTAEHYGLKVLRDNIQDAPLAARFLCVSREPEIYPGADKSSFVFTISNEPGSLALLLSKFTALGINVSRVESRVPYGREYERVVYLDIDESVYSPEMESLLRDLEAECVETVYLGSYSEEVCQ